ncbi:hypothetical protein BKA62DRAFT_773030 [Auriculariales sp. MPI-PUGE-AT-0066]|nr:hypothetical protein BKA62DRAFT_773030 [Auriculariales sp. MPI-PUGE-AT-0066]
MSQLYDNPDLEVDDPTFPDQFYYHRDEDEGAIPRTSSGCVHSPQALRDKPEWWRKFKDAEIAAKWEQEALDQGLSKAEVDYVLAELEDYALLRDDSQALRCASFGSPEQNARPCSRQVPCFDKILQSDTLIADTLRTELKKATNTNGLESSRNSSIVLPTVPVYGPSKLSRTETYSVKNRTAQIIVKLASIILTPDSPTYPGGSWHVEGMKNERIVASGIYYWDEENISESRLGFRQAVRAPSYDQNDVEATLEVWGLANQDELVQELGSVVTKQGRCICFPNIYQHPCCAI